MKSRVDQAHCLKRMVWSICDSWLVLSQNLKSDNLSLTTVAITERWVSDQDGKDVLLVIDFAPLATRN